MRITVNGKVEEFPEGIGIHGILDDFKIRPEGIVVELNSTIIRKNEWQNAVLQNNDAVELISFVGGG